MTKELEKVAEIMNRELARLGLAPGDEIWVIRGACYECPQKDDHCQIDCANKNKRYLEKVTILRAEITIGDGVLPTYRFTDSEDDTFCLKDVGETVFTDRDEAIAKL